MLINLPELKLSPKHRKCLDVPFCAVEVNADDDGMVMLMMMLLMMLVR